jgi:ferredoxin like protein
MSLDRKLHTLKYTPDEVSHLKPVCKKCNTKTCTFICPAQVYKCEDDELVVEYENCLECGACRIACEHIEWQYPRGTKGVMFKHG